MRDPTIPPQPHHLEAERIRLEIARHQTPEQKLRAIRSLQQTAIELKGAMVRAENPGMSDDAVKRVVRDWVLYG